MAKRLTDNTGCAILLRPPAAAFTDWVKRARRAGCPGPSAPARAHWLQNNAVQNREFIPGKTGERRSIVCQKIVCQNLVTPMPGTFEPQTCCNDFGNHRAEVYLSGMGDLLSL